ncbi:MAG: hypothetical protein RL230_722 [Pseudomonadota bacterium]
MPLAGLLKRDKRCRPEVANYQACLRISISNDWLQLAFLARVKPDAYRKLLARPVLERFL